jgi:hypothetical protein
MQGMYTITDIVEMEVRLNYVTASWVAWYYGVPLAYIYRAVEGGRLKPVEVPTAKSRTWLFDRRRLPTSYPYVRAREVKAA